MLKDRAQKASALRLAVRKRWLPQLEVDVDPTQQINKNKYLLTDIDVLAIAQSPMGAHVKFVFDCKSGARESAIGRAFWLHGVIARIRATRGFVVLNDRVAISRDHRISASDLGVTLLHESEMEPFAVGLDASITPTDSAAASIEAWEAFLEIKSKYPNLAEYLEFSRSTYWMTKGSGDQCRKLVGKLRRIRTELDPAKREHKPYLAMPSAYFFTHSRRWRSTCSYCFCVLLHEMSTPRRCWQCCMGVRKSGGSPEDSTPRSWCRRRRCGQYLSGPATLRASGPGDCASATQALPAALMARELAFRNLTGASETETSRELAKEHVYLSKFVILAATYLTKALRLPTEFAEVYIGQMSEIQSAVLNGPATTV